MGGEGLCSMHCYASGMPSAVDNALLDGWLNPSSPISDNGYVDCGYYRYMNREETTNESYVVFK